MFSQAPNQNGTTTGAPVDPGGMLSVLLNDPIFRGIQDAFQLGWSIIELKSRIQIAALITTITGTPPTVSTPSWRWKNDTQLAVPTTGQTNASQGQESLFLQNVLSTVEDAKIKLLLPESQQNLTESAWLISLWRVTFNRIVESHKGCFPYSSTAGTYFDLPNPPDPSNFPNYQSLVANPQAYDASNMYLPYMYLYPVNQQDYADVGIQHQRDDQLTRYRLYDVTRRAINCLTLLYTDPNESLIPVTVSDFQTQLVQNVTNFSQLAATINNTTLSGQPQGDPTTLNQPIVPQGDKASVGQPGTETGDPAALPFDQQRNNAIQLLSTQTIRFLETWDTYVRETLYGNGGEDVQANEVQLVAFEAGRAMASLSWGITTTIVPFENALHTMPESTKRQDPYKGLDKYLDAAWLNVFDESKISRIQLQISALSVVLDAAYERNNPGNQNPRSDTTRPDLPSQSIEAVENSLAYWQRAVRLLTDEVLSPFLPYHSGIAHKAKWEVFGELLDALSQQENIWQSLLLGRQSLKTYTSESITRKLYNDFMSQFQQAARPSLLVTVQTAHKTIRRRNIMLIGFGVLLAVLLAGLLIPMFEVQNKALFSILVSTITVIFGFASTFADPLNKFFVSFMDAQSSKTKETGTPDSSSPIQRFTQAFGLTNLEMVTTFEKGYQQILFEFNDLNQNVSITYPLIEFLKRNSSLLREDYEIKDDYEFLTKIAWIDQKQQAQIEQRVLAAFGLLGTYVGAQLGNLDAPTSSSKKPKVQ
jgi:hypothetical protein